MKKILVIFAAALTLTACANTDSDEQPANGTSAAETTVDTAETTTEETVSGNDAAEDYLDLTAGMCLSELYFGMSRDEAEAAVNAELDEETLNPFYSIYSDISVDLDENFTSASISYGESGLDEITLYSGKLTEEEGFELKDSLISRLGELYGLSENDWDIENDGFSNYCKKDGVSVYIRLYEADDSVSVTLMITSWEHRSFKDTPKRPIIQILN